MKARKENDSLYAVLNLTKTEVKLLSEVGVWNRFRFLVETCSLHKLLNLSIISKIPALKLLDAVYYCDLMRVKGLGPNSAKLLIKNKIRTVKALAKQDPKKLFLLLNSDKENEKEVRLFLVNKWIISAKSLDIIIHYK